MIEIHISPVANQTISAKVFQLKHSGSEATIIGSKDKLHIFLAGMLNMYFNKTVTYYAEDFSTVQSHPFFSDWLNIIVLSDMDDDSEGYNIYYGNELNLIFLMDELNDIAHLENQFDNRNVLVSIHN